MELQGQHKTELVNEPRLKSLSAFCDYNFEKLIPKFLDYAQIELTLAPETITKYRESLKWLTIYLPEVVDPGVLELDHIIRLKKQMLAKDLSESRVNSIIFALRTFLIYCNDILKINTISPKEIKPMRLPKRQVIYLTVEELLAFFAIMKTKDIRGLRMRALSEFLAETGLRISEALSLNKEDLDWNLKEVVVIGKGNKERTAYFGERSETWLTQYLLRRKDNNPALFVTTGTAKRLTRFDLSKQFKRYAKLAGIKKKLTPHILRHTMATTLLRNGCPINYIQELLGHADLKTTAQYYLGTDKRALKEAHSKFSGFR